MTDKNFHKILWTGGWDSTFQLLMLLLKRKQKVTPIYLLDTNRRSLATEIKTMSSIRYTLFNLHPECRDLLNPTVYHAVDDIPPDEEISRAYNSITQEQHLGSQYEWLARYCKHENIEDIQLSIETGGSAQSLIGHMIEPAKTENSYPRVTSANPADPIYTIFRYFSFPVIYMTKHEMQSIATKNGWQQFMEMTWFCLTPTRRHTPCGVCNPCRLAIKEGFGWRIPVRSRIFSTAYKATDPLRSQAKKGLINLGVMRRRTV